MLYKNVRGFHDARSSRKARPFRARQCRRIFKLLLVFDRTNAVNYFSSINRRTDFSMRYLHTMIGASDLDKTLEFFVNHLGLVEIRRYDSEQGRLPWYSSRHPMMSTTQKPRKKPFVEITYNWDRSLRRRQKLWSPCLPSRRHLRHLSETT